MSSVNLLDENLLLWNQFRSGDADAFGELMRIHYNDLFKYGCRFTKDEELVKDCIQDLFLVLWQKRNSISETSFVKFYLLKALRRELVRVINKNKLFTSSIDINFGGLLIDFNSAETKIIMDESMSRLTQKIRSIINDLSKRQQEIIYLRFYMDADVEEISEIMNLNRQSVYNLLHDAIKKLKDLSIKRGISLSSFYNSLNTIISFL